MRNKAIVLTLACLFLVSGLPVAGQSSSSTLRIVRTGRLPFTVLNGYAVAAEKWAELWRRITVAVRVKSYPETVRRMDGYPSLKGHFTFASRPDAEAIATRNQSRYDGVSELLSSARNLCRFRQQMNEDGEHGGCRAVEITAEVSAGANHRSIATSNYRILFFNNDGVVEQRPFVVEGGPYDWITLKEVLAAASAALTWLDEAVLSFP